MNYLLNINKCCKKKPIDFLTDNNVERLKVSLIERSSDNRIYKGNPLNDNFMTYLLMVIKG